MNRRNTFSHLLAGLLVLAACSDSSGPGSPLIIRAEIIPSPPVDGQTVTARVTATPADGDPIERVYMILIGPWGGIDSAVGVTSTTVTIERSFSLTAGFGPAIFEVVGSVISASDSVMTSAITALEDGENPTLSAQLLSNSAGVTPGDTMWVRATVSDDLQVHHLILTVDGAFQRRDSVPVRGNFLDLDRSVPVPNNAALSGLVRITLTAVDYAGNRTSVVMQPVPVVAGP